MGMYPVSYYDLSQAGVPVHSDRVSVPLTMRRFGAQSRSGYSPRYCRLELNRERRAAPESRGDSRVSAISSPVVVDELLEEYDAAGQF